VRNAYRRLCCPVDIAAILPTKAVVGLEFVSGGDGKLDEAVLMKTIVPRFEVDAVEADKSVRRRRPE